MLMLMRGWGSTVAILIRTWKARNVSHERLRIQKRNLSEVLVKLAAMAKPFFKDKPIECVPTKTYEQAVALEHEKIKIR